MADDVFSCLRQASFGGNSVLCHGGVQDNDYIFNDKQKLKQFLLLSEEGKLECDWTYKATRNEISNNLSWIWVPTAAFLGHMHTTTKCSIIS